MFALYIAFKHRFPFIIFLLILLAGISAVYVDWNWKRKLSPHGGQYFFHRVELAVPLLRQPDDRWRDDPLGGLPDNGTLGGEGCAVAAAASYSNFMDSTAISKRYDFTNRCPARSGAETYPRRMCTRAVLLPLGSRPKSGRL